MVVVHGGVYFYCRGSLCSGRLMLRWGLDVGVVLVVVVVEGRIVVVSGGYCGGSWSLCMVVLIFIVEVVIVLVD